MNYTQITINGDLVGLKFGMYCSQLFFEAIDKGKKLMVGDTLNELGISYILWYGYLNNCEVKQVDPKLTFEDFYSLVESSSEGNDEIVKALDIWASSKPVQKVLSTIEESKKKLSGPILSD